MKNKKIFIIIVVMILILLVAIGIAFMLKNNEKTELFIHSYENYAWGQKVIGLSFIIMEL